MASFLSGQRFVLLIGDEGAVLLRMAGSTVRDRCFAPSPEPEDRTEMEAMLAEAPRLPLLLLVDVLEQSFVKDTIPPVGYIDEAGVLQRKLRTTFPDARIRGAKYLGRDRRSARKDKEYLFVSVPETKLIAAWLEWARNARNPVRAIALLPLESLTLATRLSESLHDRGDRPDWIVLVTRHRTGGFRQIVLHKGELVFSRLTQSAPPDAGPAEIAATVDREHKLTMGYLRRMAFNEEQGLDVIVLGQPGVGRELLRLGMPEHQLTVIAPHDAAAMFKLRGVADPEDSYGEIVHGAWAGQRRRPSLALMPEEIVHHQVGILTTRAGYVATVLVVAYLSYGLVDAWLVGADMKEEADRLAAMSAERAAELNQAIRLRGGYSVSAPEVTDTIELYDRLEAAVPTPMPILAALASRLGENVRANRINWAVSASSIGGQAQLVLSFDILDSGGDVEVAMEISQSVADQLAGLLPGMEVVVTGPPLDVLPTQSLSGQLDLSTAAAEAEERVYTTEITIGVPIVDPFLQEQGS
jgi:hypothetical protein